MDGAGLTAAELASRAGLTEAAISLLRSGRREPSYRTLQRLGGVLPAIVGGNLGDTAFDRVDEAIADVRAGRMVIVLDDEDRENEGDLVMAAQMVTPEAINFMRREAGGLICVSLPGRRLDELQIPQMVTDNTAVHETAFTVSVEARDVTTTGISAHDRSATIQKLLDPDARPSDFLRPGHTFPLRARDGGVLVRAGQTEASVDLARIAGLYPAGVICEIMAQDGSMARLPQLAEFCRTHGLKLLTVAELIRHRMRHERYVRRVAETVLATRYGDFRMIVFSSEVDREQHIALVRGDLSGSPPLVRVHSHCLTGDVFGSNSCNCYEIVARSLEAIVREDRGVFVYLHHTGRGFGLEQPPAGSGEMARVLYHTRGQLDQDAARQRLLQHESGSGAQLLLDLGLKSLRVLTNHPRKVVALEAYGLTIADQEPLPITPGGRTTHQRF